MKQNYIQRDFNNYLNSSLKRMLLLISLLIVISVNSIYAAFQIDATYSESPLEITLSWNSQGDEVQIYRRVLGELENTTWVLQTTVIEPTVTYTDNSIALGVSYEYQLVKDASTKGYVVAGLKLPVVENRGTMLLIIDNTQASRLSSEISRFEQDLIGDGWTVIVHESDRYWEGTPEALKAWIKTQYDANPTEVKSILLLGRLPIVKSGYSNADAHGSVPRPTDLFYADMDGVWTDATMDYSGKNIPDDGIYDQNDLPGNKKVEIQIGRIDLAGMTSFDLNETELLRQYLNKNHEWRHAISTAPLKGLCGNSYLKAETAGVYSLFNNTDITIGKFANTENAPHTWAVDFGDQEGKNYPNYNYKAAFTINFGSYKQNFQDNNNAMRAILCMPEYGLTTAWGARPYWFIHHMGMGETIGYSALRSQNNGNSDYTPEGEYTYMKGAIYTSLMGDPSLKMYIVKPISDLLSTPNGANVDLTWTASDDANSGYYVYRSDSKTGKYTRITATPITLTSFTDVSPNATNYYMVRALKLETGATGSFYNLSQGVFDQNYATVITPLTELTISPTSLDLLISSDTVKLELNITPSNATNPAVIWRSSKAHIVSVNTLGEVTAKSLGKATITAVSIDGSAIQTTCIVTVSEATGIDNNDKLEKSVSIYPNPATAEGVNITLKGYSANKSVNISVISISGKVIYTKSYDYPTTVNIPTSKLNSGTYFVKVNDNKKVLIKKLIIQLQ